MNLNYLSLSRINEERLIESFKFYRRITTTSDFVIKIFDTTIRRKIFYIKEYKLAAIYYAISAYVKKNNDL